MEKNDVDEKLMSWNNIFEELLIDVRDLTKDLHSSIGYVGASGVLVIALGLYVLFTFLRYSTIQDPILYVILGLVTGSNFIVGFINIRKFFQLRSKYTSLSKVQRDLKSS